MSFELPILAVLPELLAALSDAGTAVLIAPPGAGKTTAVAPALLDQPWCTGRVILLSPRRVAARAAAERIAEMLGQACGQTAGYLTRLDSKHGPRTRILVMTEAIFAATILDDPDLAGISAVLFDEAHERHLDSDLGLALAIECRQVLRPDLRLLVMSATIDGARFAGLLGAAPVIESAGKSYPLAIRWLGARPELRLDEAMANAIHQAWQAETGDILAFLPGVSEIRRTAERLARRLPDALVLPLHGQCEAADQRAAIRRDAQGRRRIVLATAIAETSLTLDGVSVVVDAGLSRHAQFDQAAGVTRLVTQRASQAAAAQRAGRAARQGPGVAYRLWDEAAHPGRPAFAPPEMLTADLAPLALVLAQWGAGDAGALAWIDPPPAAAMAAAHAKLAALGAFDGRGRITPHGQAMAALPMVPEHAHMLLFAAQTGAPDTAAALALLLQERGLGRQPGGQNDEDLAVRLERWRADRDPRSRSSRDLARRWATRAAQLVPPSAAGNPPPAGVLLAEAFPDNLARRRGPSGEEWLTAGGCGLRLDITSPLAGAEFLAVAEAQGEARGARITGAIALTHGEVMQWLAHRIERRSSLRWVDSETRVEALLEQRLGALVLARGPDPAPDQAAIAALICERLRDTGLAALPWTDASRSLLARARYAGLAALADQALQDTLDDWLTPLLGRRLDAVDPAALHRAMLERLGRTERATLDQHAPAGFVSPAGSHHPIDYDDPAGPSVTLRVQALFGLDRQPGFGQPLQPLLLKLTSPGGSLIQTTRDLPAFWRGSWRDVQRDMKGRYPRHRWPDEPWQETASLKTRNAFEGRARRNR